MSGAESRQRALQVALPALVVFVGYVWFGAAEPQAKLDQLRGRLAQLEQQPPVSVGARHRQLRALEDEVAAARLAKAQASERAAHLQGVGHPDEERHACEEGLIALLQRHGVHLEGTGEAPAGFVRPPSLEAARAATQAALAPPPPARRSRQAPVAPPPTPNLQHQPRALHLRGSYLDVLAALDALSATELDLVPLGLDLDARPVDGGPPRWTLVVQP